MDLRFAFRMLRQAPGYTTLAVLALALGIGANTAIFTVLDTVLVRPLPYPEPDRIVKVYETEPQIRFAPVTGPDFLDWQEQARSFEYLAAFAPRNMNLTGAGTPQRLKAGAVTCEVFHVLGVPALAGRWFQPEDCRPDQNNVILSYGTWQRIFGGSRQTVGSSIVLNGVARTVVGILPSSFRFLHGIGGDQDVYTTLVLERDESKRGSHEMFAAARLKPGIALATAQAEMDGIARRLQKEHPQTNADIGVKLVRYKEDLTGFMRRPLWVLYGAVSFVLLIACANVANLLLARAAARQREIAVRVALGASRYRIARLLLAESFILSAAGGVLGLLVALWGVDLLMGLKGVWIPRVKDATVDGGVVAYTLGVSLLTGLLFGLVPAFQYARRNVSRTLSEGSQRVGSRRGARTRSVLVATEVALAIVLLVGAGLMLRSFARLMRIDPGFPTDNILTMRLELPQSKDDADHSRFVQHALRLRDEVSRLPGVRSAGTTQKLPLAGGWNGTVVIEGRPFSESQWEGPLVENSYVSPGYLETIGMPLVAGRLLTDADVRLPSEVVVINQTAAQTFWPNENAVGKRLSRDRKPPRWIEVVGVVGDTRQWLHQKPWPEAYYAVPHRNAILAIRTSVPPASVAAAVRAKIQEVDPDQPIYEVRTMEEILADSAGSGRFYTQILGVFAATALVLAAIGVYGIMAYSVSQREQEIGVRVALGAGRPAILWMVLSRALKLIGAGLVLGVAGALLLTRFLATLLFDISTTDRPTFIGAAALLAAIALAAAYLPARRATAVDPITALRHE